MTKGIINICFVLACLAPVSPLVHADDGGDTVSIPDNLKQPPSGIQVSGEPGKGQPDTFMYKAMPTNAKGKILYGFWHMEDKAESAPLNQEALLAPGYYLVGFAGNFAEVNLHEGEHVAFKLGQINVPKVDGNYKIKIMLDLTNADEQNQYMLREWGDQRAADGTETSTWCRWHHCNHCVIRD